MRFMSKNSKISTTLKVTAIKSSPQINPMSNLTYKMMLYCHCARNITHMQGAI